MKSSIQRLVKHYSRNKHKNNWLKNGVILSMVRETVVATKFPGDPGKTHHELNIRVLPTQTSKFKSF